MSRILEREGIPVAMVSALPTIPQTSGVNRIVIGRAVTHPLGNPDLPTDQERALRRRMVLRALEALSSNVEQTTVFEVA